MSLYSKIDGIAADNKALRAELRALANRPQGQRTSIEGGALEFNDSDGNLKAILGERGDGSNTLEVVSGPTPPTPANFTVDVDFGELIVHWDGEFEDALVANADWARTEVYAQPGQFVTPSREHARGSMVAASGGEVSIGVLKGTWTICLVSWSQAGKMSPMSAPITVEVPGYGEIVLDEIDAARTAIKNAGEMLMEGQETLAEKLAGMGEGVDPEKIAEDIATARQEAIDAALAEIETVEGTLTSALGTKNAMMWSTLAPPVDYSGSVDDLWVTMSSLAAGGREVSRARWDGSTWISQKIDGVVLSNIDAATINTGFLDVVNRIRAGAILADKLLIGRERNLIPNGDLELGENIGWPSDAIVETGAGPNGSNAITFPAGSGYNYDPFQGQRFPVTPGETLVYETWVKADTPDSWLYVTLQDQTGPTTSTSGRVQSWTAVEGPEPTSQGPVAGFVVSTEWTKLVSRKVVPEGVESVIVQAFYLNHTSGSNRDAAVSFAGMKLYKPVGGTLIEPGGIQTPHLAADVMEVGNLKAGTAELSEAVIKKLFAEVVVAQMVQASEFIGENAILTGAVTASKITASEELWAKLGQFVKIRTEQLEADAIDGMVVTGATFRSPDDGFNAGDAGLFISGPDGTSYVRFPTDGSALSLTAADVEIERANLDSLEMRSGSVRSGGVLTIESGVTAPVSPPVVTAGWSEIANVSAADDDRPSRRSGFDSWGSKWVRSLNIHSNVEDDRIQILNSDGSLDREIPLDFNPRYGLTVLGDIAYVLGVAWSGGEQLLRGYDLNTGSRVKSWTYDRTIESIPALGNNGTDLVIAGVYQRALWVHRRSTSTGEQIGPDLRSIANSWPEAEASDLFGVWMNSANDEIIVVPTVAARVYSVYATTNLVRKADPDNHRGYEGWENPGSSPAGVCWTASGEPIVATVTGEVFQGSKEESDYKVDAVVTWYDGSHETLPGPNGSISVLARQFPTLSLPYRPGLRKRVYWKVNNAYAWRREEVAESVKSVRLDPEIASFAYFPPTQNTFPETAPAEVRTSDRNFELSGNGSGHWGDLQVAANGELSGIPRAATGGGIDFPTVGSNSSQTIVVTLPSGRFTKTPSVSAMTSQGRLTPVVFNITKDSFSFRVWNFTSSSASAAVGTWLAVQEA